MAKSRDDHTLHWIDPDQRGILPLEAFHIPRSLQRTLKREIYEIRVDSDFAEVIRQCAQSTPNREETWINQTIFQLFNQLHEFGVAHSVEAWADGKLVGGLYGLALGSAFFGESMFSRATDASKAALVDLVARLRAGGFLLLDTQFVTSHLAQFGAIEISRREYLRRLSEAIEQPAHFSTAPLDWRKAFDTDV